MRVRLGGEDGDEEFSNLLMSIGNGTLENTNGVITIPSSLGTIVNSQEELIARVYEGIHDLPNLQSLWLCDRAILTPTNECASEINTKILALFVSEERTYLSINTALSQDDAVHYPAEFLDSVTASGLPAHAITVKVGAPILLLRNLNAPKLCNGTRLRVRALHRNVIEAEILTGCGIGESVFIPRIPMIATNYPFEFKRVQFPISICFAMTINKSQGQTLACAGLELSRSDCFSHGQLYVACSRVKTSNSLFIHAPEGRTHNVVYQEVLL
ncbi:uncharacterized protein LOC103522643 [Diaphorina citri]|uniref:Uncharacterized protein LOC103522643 n=1 Tax=Diaphorina citri TaxID=121845 RepID=A0A1S3DQH5_DIACI|nr:uncharacterized protein LOC103522643 [Diaphorina citri]